jgi:UDP-2,3-diacylglucosamine pyrophosphatase LpxH
MMTRVRELEAFIRERAAEAKETPVELVINGDFVDFLAERPKSAKWTPFRYDPDEAAATLDVIVERDQQVFTALGDFIRAGGALTIVLGNHDVELALPQVHAALDRALATRNYRFVNDGESYWAAENLVIEHGDRFDPTNRVDHEGLHRLRRHLSRGLRAGSEDLFEPPRGSVLVADVMNPLKQTYRFIDLLKPESEPLFALLLALEPGAKAYLGRFARALGPVPLQHLKRVVLGDIAASPAIAAAESEVDAELLALLSTTVSNPSLALGEQAIEPVEIGIGDWVVSKWALINLLVTDDQALDKRLAMVRQALRAVDGDRTFDATFEPSKRFVRGVAALAGTVTLHHPYVVLGHTHHAKRITVDDPDGSSYTYVNTGTWANLMRFPIGLLDPDEDRAREALRVFVQDLIADRDLAAGFHDERPLDKYLLFVPSFARAEIDAHGVATNVELKRYTR